MLKGFKQFLLRGNVVDLAVAVVIGAAFGAVIASFVKDLLTPLLAALGGRPDFSRMYFTLNNSRFMYGDFVNAILSFVIIAGAVYFIVVLPVSRLAARRATESAPTTRKCPECLSEIPLEARKCAFCASVVSPVSALKTGS